MFTTFTDLPFGHPTGLMPQGIRGEGVPALGDKKQEFLTFKLNDNE